MGEISRVAPRSAPYSRWRYWLSFIWDQTLIAGSSDQTDYLAVILRKGKLLLQANGAIYSWEDNYYNFRSAFEVMKWDLLPGKRCLLLGLGLGSVPQMIEELFEQQLTYVAVEYDETIASLAEEFLLYRLTSPIETHIVDALQFMQLNKEKFDLILLDIFVDDAVPPQFDTKQFLILLKQALDPNGLLISNRLALQAIDRVHTEAYFFDVFGEVFPNADKVDVRSNLMLFSNKNFLSA